MRRTLNVVSLVGAVLLLTECRPTGDATKTDRDKSVNGLMSPSNSPAAGLPPCAQAKPPIPVPPEFPKSFPLPPGTVFTASQQVEPEGLLVDALSPMEFKQAARFFGKNLFASGFRLGEGEEEAEAEAEAGEVEARFAGNGVTGSLTVRTIADCPGAVQLTVRVRRVQTKSR